MSFSHSNYSHSLYECLPVVCLLYNSQFTPLQLLVHVGLYRNVFSLSPHSLITPLLLGSSYLRKLRLKSHSHQSFPLNTAHKLMICLSWSSWHAKLYAKIFVPPLQKEIHDWNSHLVVSVTFDVLSCMFQCSSSVTSHIQNFLITSVTVHVTQSFY